MNTSHTFGGGWTEDKLERLRKYLSAYMTIFTVNPYASKFRAIYVDAFAGTGYRNEPRSAEGASSFFPIEVDEDARAFQQGSADIALQVHTPFHRYIFVDKKPDHVAALEQLRVKHPTLASRIQIVQEDANSYLRQWCATCNWRQHRAVVFLDPYGMQVEWNTIAAIAETQAIDLWVLFPLGQAVNRLLTKREPPPAEWADALTRFLGTPDWEKAFYRSYTQMTLFGPQEVTEKEADFDSIGQFFIERLKTVFAGVASNPLPLRNSRNVPIYLLCFAAGNSKGAPTAVRIAQNILKQR